jgi:hypothetical protein
MLFEIGRKAGDLFELIFRRNRNEDGFVEAATDEFHLAALDQFFQADKVLGAVLLDPGKQRSGVMEAEMNAGIFLEMLEEREVASVKGFFEDVLEIAAGLVSVNEQG